MNGILGNIYKYIANQIKTRTNFYIITAKNIKGGSNVWL